jgi:hypothetical protein
MRGRRRRRKISNAATEADVDLDTATASPMMAAPLPRPYLSGRLLGQLLIAFFVIPVLVKSQFFGTVLISGERFLTETVLRFLGVHESGLVHFIYAALILIQFWLVLRTLGMVQLSTRWQSVFLLAAGVALAFRSIFTIFEPLAWTWRVPIGPHEPPYWAATGAVILAWSLLGRERLGVKIVGATLAGVLLANQWFTVEGRRASANLNFVITAQLVGVLTVAIFAKTMGLGWLRDLQGDEIQSRGETELAEPAGQFRFVHVIVAMTCLAMAMAMLRSVGMVTDESWQQILGWLQDPPQRWGPLALMIVTGVVTCSLGLIVGLRGDAHWLRLFILALGVLGIATLAHWIGLGILESYRAGTPAGSWIVIDDFQPTSWWEWFRVCFTYAAIPVVLLSGYRAAGYRWGRRGTPVPSKQS